ncbi:MAG: hypothetical protein SOW46_10245 [Candidatus Aphodomonas sp.]|nr:hypothetical protein [Candidatus Aphodomonas sp.]
MIYLRMKPRVTARVGQMLTLADVADVLADASLSIGALPVSLPLEEGIWPLDALTLIMRISEKAPNETVNVLGDGTGWLHRQAKTAAEKRRAWGWQALRTAVVCVLLFAGSALTIGWFHTDVNMEEAQTAIFRAVAGREPASPLWIAVPYAAGVGLGALLYYLRIRRDEASPLTVKLREYAEDMEKNAQANPS